MPIEFSKQLTAHQTPIPGVVLFDLPVHGDNRGWFKENWQREKMRDLGLPDFGPVQNNISFNDKAGTTRSIHAEPWDKFVSVASGRAPTISASDMLPPMMSCPVLRCRRGCVHAVG